MTILFLSDFNPYCVSSAISNRYLGLLEGLMNNGVEVVLCVRECASENELSCDQLYFHRNRLKVVYLKEAAAKRKTIVSQIKVMMIGDRLGSSEKKRLNDCLKQPYDFCWLAGHAAYRRFYLGNKKKFNKKIIFECNEYLRLYRQEKKLFFLRRWQFYNEYRITLKVLKHVDLFLVMTKTLIGYYEKLASKKAHFLHLPMTVQIDRFNGCRMDDRFKPPYVAYTGTYTNIKDGVSILIEAFALIANKYPDYKLYLAGFNHPDMAIQKQIIKKNKIEDRVFHVGALDKEEIPSFICNASLLVLARPDSHQAQGGFPTKLGEYLATGNPVCVTSVGEIPDYLEDNVTAFLAKPGDVESFADAIDRALSDKVAAKEVGLHGRRIAETVFNSEYQAKRIIEFLIAKKND